MAGHTVNHGGARSFIGRRSTFRSTPRHDQGLCARRERLKEQGDGLLRVLTVVAQPGGDGAALAREIPGARLLVLSQVATAIPDAAADEVAAAMLAL
jgi:hypothetical protein